MYHLLQIPKGFMVNEEIELGVIIGKKGKHIKESEALDYIGGYCAALDMTAMSFLVNPTFFIRTHIFITVILRMRLEVKEVLGNLAKDLIRLAR